MTQSEHDPLAALGDISEASLPALCQDLENDPRFVRDLTRALTRANPRLALAAAAEARHAGRRYRSEIAFRLGVLFVIGALARPASAQLLEELWEESDDTIAEALESGAEAADVIPLATAGDEPRDGDAAAPPAA